MERGGPAPVKSVKLGRQSNSRTLGGPAPSVKSAMRRAAGAVKSVASRRALGPRQSAKVRMRARPVKLRVESCGVGPPVKMAVLSWAHLCQTMWQLH